MSQPKQEKNSHPLEKKYKQSAVFLGAKLSNKKQQAQDEDQKSNAGSLEAQQNNSDLLDSSVSDVMLVTKEARQVASERDERQQLNEDSLRLAIDQANQQAKVLANSWNENDKFVNKTKITRVLHKRSN